MAIGRLELAFRIVSTLFVIVAPTVLFLALWRGLDAMRDDELIERAQRRAETMEGSGGEWRVDPAAATARLAGGDPAPEGMVACPACGAQNREGVSYCRQCLGELD